MILPYVVYDGNYYNTTVFNSVINHISILADKDLDQYIKNTTITEDSEIIVENIKEWISCFDIDSIGLDNFLALTYLTEENKWKKKLYQVSNLDNRNCTIWFGRTGKVILCRVSRKYANIQNEYVSLFEFMDTLEQEGSTRIFVNIEARHKNLM